MIVQCATFSKSLNPQNIVKSISDIRFPFESSFWISVICLQTHYPAGYPTGKPDSDHLWWASCSPWATTWVMRQKAMQ